VIIASTLAGRPLLLALLPSKTIEIPAILLPQLPHSNPKQALPETLLSVVLQCTPVPRLFLPGPFPIPRRPGVILTHVSDAQQTVIQHANGARPDPDVLQPLEEEGRMLISLVPPGRSVPGTGRPPPVRRHQARLEPDKVGDALDQAARRVRDGTGIGATASVVGRCGRRGVLVAVDQLVGQHAGQLAGGVREGGGAPADVGQGEMDLLVVVVQLGARRVGNAAEVAKDDGHGAGGRDGRGEEAGPLRLRCRGGGGSGRGRRGILCGRGGERGKGRRRVEVPDDGGKSGLEDGLDVRQEREEGGRGGVAEVVDMEAERWGREPRAVARDILLLPAT